MKWENEDRVTICSYLQRDSHYSKKHTLVNGGNYLREEGGKGNFKNDQDQKGIQIVRQ